MSARRSSKMSTASIARPAGGPLGELGGQRPHLEMRARGQGPVRPVFPGVGDEDDVADRAAGPVGPAVHVETPAHGHRTRRHATRSTVRTTDHDRRFAHVGAPSHTAGSAPRSFRRPGFRVGVPTGFRCETAAGLKLLKLVNAISGPTRPISPWVPSSRAHREVTATVRRARVPASIPRPGADPGGPARRADAEPAVVHRLLGAPGDGRDLPPRSR